MSQGVQKATTTQRRSGLGSVRSLYHSQKSAIGTLDMGTTNIKKGYYSVKSLNPNGIVPDGPDLSDLGL